MIICSKCGEEKPRADFPKHNNPVICKTCKNAKAREAYNANLEDNRAKKREADHRRYTTEKRREKGRKWRESHPEAVKYWNEKTREYRNEWRKGWLKTKPGYQTHYSNLRRQAIKQAMPLWAKSDKSHKEQIAEIYKSAKVRSIFHEVPFEVDHIEPLRGKASCGLHLVWNLQVLPAAENNSKSNKLIVQPN